MAVYKRGGVWWYEFNFKGRRVQESTRQSNKAVAHKIEAAHKTRLALGQVGILEKTAAPTLAEFAPRFVEAIKTLCASKPATVQFYQERLRRVLEHPNVASCALDQIDEGVIAAYRQERSREKSRLGTLVAPASINRELATIRRLLRLAQEWKVIDRVPRIRLLGGEREREFVLTYELERVYLATARQPLCDVGLLILDTGLRAGETERLEWPDVHLEPATGARFGYVHIREGKSRYARRNVSLTGRASRMLEARKAAADSPLVFGGFLVSSLDHQHALVRKALKLPKDFVVHSLRHTALTRLGEAGADAFGIMRIAGHSSVTISQRYVHPSPEALETAFERLDAMNTRKRDRLPAISPTVGKTAMRENPTKPLTN